MLLAYALLGLVACAPPSPARASASEAPPLLVLVSLDTTRADRMGGPFGNTRGLTPNLDAFAAEAVAFTDTWAVGNLTSLSHAAMFTSRYPSEIGKVSGDFHLGPRVPTLPGILALYGWEAAAFTSGGHLTRNFGLDRGFTWFEHTPFQGSLWHTVPVALRWLDEERPAKPTMVLVHGYDPHTPYLAPAPYGRAWADPGYSREAPGSHATAQRLGIELIFGKHLFRANAMLGYLVHRNQPRSWDAAARAAIDAEAATLARDNPGQVEAFGPADAQYVSDVYDGAIAYQDAMFGELVRGLKARGLYDEATFVVFSDHGEALGEDGRFGHGEDLIPGELHVPLYIKAPGVAARAVDAPVSLLDVLPTLCELTGVTAPAQARGHSLVPWLRGEQGPSHPWRFAEGNLDQQTVADADGQLIVEGLNAASRHYRAVVERTPLEGPAFRGTGAPADPAARAPYRDALLRWRSELETLDAAAPASAEAVEEMKKNGYFTP